MENVSFSKQAQFKNFTTQDFTWKYGGVSYTFEGGCVYNVPAELALHFAKHLAQREMGDNPFNETQMKALMNQCFPGTNIEEIAKGQTSGAFEKIVNGEAKPGAKTVEPNATVASVQNEPQDDGDDEKEDNKPPKFKAKPQGRPKGKSKDDEYIA